MTIEKMDSLGKLYKTGKIGPNYQKRSLNKLKIHSFVDLVKSLKRHISVIPANPGSRPGQAPESSYFKYLKILWTPVSTGVTTFYDSTIFEDLVIF